MNLIFSLKQEIHDLRQKLELQSSENDENQNTFRRRFQDTVSDLTSQVEALSKGKARFINHYSFLFLLNFLFLLDMIRKVKRLSWKSKN